MAWLSSVTSANTKIVGSNPYYQYLFSSIAGYLNRRLVTHTETHYVGLTEAAADSQVTASLAVSGVQAVKKQRIDDSGQYMVVEEKETYGAWEYVSTITPVGPPP
jgi:hypothetical protein